MRAFVTIVMLAFGALAFAEPATAPPASSANDVVIGDFELVRVVDGDTIRVKGLDSSLRLLGIDTEETFKHDKERRAYAKGFAEYAKAVRGTSKRPAKFATPLGDEAKRWAEAWFKDVAKIRLERDDPHEVKDRYRRYLAYVLAEKHGTWLNYNVEAVRAGMSPYFPKYGRSRRFDREFIAAEAEAKAAKRGIWAAGAEAYPDYPEREAWWTARGEFVATFHKEAASAKHATFIDLTHDDAPAQLQANVGHEVVALGTVGEIDRAGEHAKRKHGRGGSRADRLADGVDDGADDGIEDGADDRAEEEAADGVSETRPHGKAPTRVVLDNHVVLVFFDPDVLAASGISAWKGEWIRVTGKPSLYHSQLEIVIDRTAQIELSPVPGLTKPTVAPAAKPVRNREKSVPIPAP